MLLNKIKEGLIECEAEIAQDAKELVTLISQSNFEQALKVCQGLQNMIVAQLVVNKLLTQEV